MVEKEIAIKKICVCVCMYKMVVKITKETWQKCGFKKVKHYNEKEDISELWQNVSNVETQIKHSNICDIALKNIVEKKQKIIQKKKNKNTKHFLKVKKVFFLLKSLHVISLNVVN